MYYCVLHSWSSHETPCPSCNQTVTTGSGTPFESPSPSNALLLREALQKYKKYVANITWHIDTNKPEKQELSDCLSMKGHYEEIIRDLEALSQYSSPSQPEEKRQEDGEWVSAKQLDRQEDKIEHLEKCLKMLRYLYMNEYCGEHGNEVRKLIITQPRRKPDPSEDLARKQMNAD